VVSGVARQNAGQSHWISARERLNSYVCFCTGRVSPTRISFIAQDKEGWFFMYGQRRLMRSAIVAAIISLMHVASSLAVVIPTSLSDTTIVANGQAASTAGLFGAIEAVHQSGSAFHASITMLTDFTGNSFTIQPTPANSTHVDIGGFGIRGTVGGSLSPQDGKPGQWSTKEVAIPTDFVDPSIYGATKISDPTVDTGATPGDSGGRVGNSSGPIGVISAVDGTSSGSITYFVMLSTSSVESWIDEVEHLYPAGTIFGVCAAHTALDPDDPVHLTTVDFTDYNNPTQSFDVIGTAVNPSYVGNAKDEFNGFQTDLAIVALSPVPEPAGLAIVGLLGVGLLRRRA
jgi:hypothetical protein